jgi:hypothetical protein
MRLYETLIFFRKTLRGEALRTQSVSFVANEDRGKGEDRSRKWGRDWDSR